MEPSTFSPVKPITTQQKNQVFHQSSSPKSPQTGIHRVRLAGSTESPEEKTMNLRSGCLQDQARALVLRQGSRCEIANSTDGQTSCTSESKQGNNRQTVYEHLVKRLMSLAGIEPSNYPRRYPPEVMTTRKRSDAYDREELSACCKEIEAHFQGTLQSQDFSSYLNAKGIHEPFTEVTKLEVVKLELYTQFIFQTHPLIGKVSFSCRHHYALIFPDDVIDKIYYLDSERTKKVGSIEVLFTQNDKPIIQQTTSTNSGAAIAAMFAYEQGKDIRSDRVQDTDCDNQDSIFHKLECLYNIPCQKKKINALAKLSEEIEKNRSVAVLVRRGGHSCWVAVDKVDFEQERIRCRNPYNCEELEVKQQAFCNMWCTDQEVILAHLPPIQDRLFRND